MVRVLLQEAIAKVACVLLLHLCKTVVCCGDTAALWILEEGEVAQTRDDLQLILMRLIQELGLVKIRVVPIETHGVGTLGQFILSLPSGLAPKV